MTREELIEALADKEHASWSHWMHHLFSKGTFHIDGSFTIEADSVYRWLQQAETPYAELTEPEKQSDRNEVAKIIPIIEAYR